VSIEQHTPEGSVEAPAPSPAEAGLSPQEQESLRVAREGLPVVDPHAKPVSATPRPDGVPEKFWDAEKGVVRVDALTQSYAELEAKLSGKVEAPKEPEGDPADVEVKNGKIVKKEGEAEAGEAAPNPLTETITAAATEFTADGKFTEETATKLAELGIPPEVQQVYLAGLSALQSQQTATVHGYVGGEDKYNAMAAWAGKNLSDAELDAFNASLDNPALAQNAVIGLYTRYSQAAPSEGTKLAPTNGMAASSDVFASRDELTHAMSDPRYRTDPVYQKQVVEKLARTRASGVSFNR
jgi:hypothetical protein